MMTTETESPARSALIGSVRPVAWLTSEPDGNDGDGTYGGMREGVELGAERRTEKPPKFKRGDHVRKISGAAWGGLVVGEYSTTLTPEGYAVESSAHPGSVQIYPAAALERVA